MKVDGILQSMPINKNGFMYMETDGNMMPP